MHNLSTFIDAKTDLGQTLCETAQAIGLDPHDFATGLLFAVLSRASRNNHHLHILQHSNGTMPRTAVFADPNTPQDEPRENAEGSSVAPAPAGLFDGIRNND